MGEEEGGEGGRGKEDQGGFVKHAVRRLEGDSTNLKLPRCVKPSGRRGGQERWPGSDTDRKFGGKRGGGR